MRVLLAVPPSTARLHAVAPLGWALRSAGHQAHVASAPAFTDQVTRTGMVAVAAPDTDTLAAHAALWRPDVVVWDDGPDGAPHAAAVARAAGAVGVRLLGPWSDDVVDDLPCDPAGRLPGGTACGSAADVTLDLVPPALRPRGAPGSVPLRFVPFTGGAVLPSWLRRRPRKPRVLVCGRLAGQAAAALFEAIAAGGSRAEHVCELADGVQPPPGTRLPSSARLFESAPRGAVLASSVAVVHDGAPAVTLAAVAAGLPQLALTAAGPGRALVARVADEGAALVADPAAGSSVSAAAALGALLDRLLDDADLEKHAARLRDDVLAARAPSDVVPLLVAAADRR